LEIGMVDSEGSTALHTAAAAAHVEFCRYVCFSVSSTVLLAVSICIEAVLSLSICTRMRSRHHFSARALGVHGRR
jgi:hypothetical protein